jgi:hypothetical protein
VTNWGTKAGKAAIVEKVEKRFELLSTTGAVDDIKEIMGITIYS